MIEFLPVPKRKKQRVPGAGHLTARQARFVEEFVINGNAAAAARLAGYSERTARQMGHENLTKPDILASIEALRRKNAVQYGLRKDDVVTAVLGAINTATAQSKPAIAITGWAHVAKLMGFYDQASVPATPISGDAARLLQKFEAMSDDELMAIAAGGAVGGETRVTEVTAN